MSLIGYIGNQLTEKEFNSIISLYRHFKPCYEQFKINEDIIGDYGEYSFDIENTTIIDDGILVSEETITAKPRVKLTNNLFKHSTYTLQLSILHYSNVNILDDVDPHSFKIIDVLEVTLIPDTWVEIPLDNIYNGFIIEFDAKIKILHDKPVIQGSWVNDIELTSDKDIISTGEVATLTATALDIGSIGVPNLPVTFKLYKQSDDTLVDTLTGTTDINGQCSVSYVSKGAGHLNIKAECMNLIETYELIDSTFVDHGTSTSYSTWASTNINLTRDSDTQLTQTDSSTAGTYRLLNFNGDYCFEFDIKLSNEGAFYVNFRKGTSGKGSVLDPIFRYADDDYHHVKLAVKGFTVDVSVDGESKNSVNLSDNWDRFYFNLTNGVTVNYKDFCYYPI